MTNDPPITLATLHGAVGERVSLGWTPRARRSLLSKKAGPDKEQWIKVRSEVRCPDGDWTFIDEALTEQEAHQLVEWLSVRLWEGPRTLSFIAPCLAFSTRGTLGGLLNVNLTFKGESAPPFVQRDPEWRSHHPSTLGLFVQDDELCRFTDALRKML